MGNGSIFMHSQSPQSLTILRDEFNVLNPFFDWTQLVAFECGHELLRCAGNCQGHLARQPLVVLVLVLNIVPRIPKHASRKQLSEQPKRT